jgi:transcription elongation factor Elf1
MTSQTKHFIELSDIVGIEFSCKRCGISLLVKGDAIATAVGTYSEMLHQCPTCKHAWTVPESYPASLSADTHLKKFVRMLEEINNLQASLGCGLRFEISNESVEK